MISCVEPLHGEEEIAAMGLEGPMPDLMKVAFMGVPIVIVWELVRS